MKTCTRCEVVKRRADFYADKRRKSGLYSWCKVCFREHCRSADAARLSPRERSEKAKAAAVERLRRWRAANPDRAAMVNREAQARRRATEGVKVDFEQILAEHGMVCHICGDGIADRAELHFDHVIPLAKGGPHTGDNIRPSHSACNLRKRSRILVPA